MHIPFLQTHWAPLKDPTASGCWKVGTTPWSPFRVHTGPWVLGGFLSQLAQCSGLKTKPERHLSVPPTSASGGVTRMGPSACREPLEIPKSSPAHLAGCGSLVRTLRPPASSSGAPNAPGRSPLSVRNIPARGPVCCSPAPAQEGWLPFGPSWYNFPEGWRAPGRLVISSLGQKPARVTFCTTLPWPQVAGWGAPR